MSNGNLKSSLDKYPDFYQKVWKVTCSIPCGEIRSYEWVASRAGKPSASRAAGNALSRNPFPGIIPCHRIIMKNGNTGNYFMGRKLKECLLIKEKNNRLDKNGNLPA